MAGPLTGRALASMQYVPKASVPLQMRAIELHNLTKLLQTNTTNPRPHFRAGAAYGQGGWHIWAFEMPGQRFLGQAVIFV